MTLPSDSESEKETAAHAKLFAYLAKQHPHISRIEVAYDGYGDEGWIDSIQIFDDDGVERHRGPLPRGMEYRRDALKSAKVKAEEDDKLWALVEEVWYHTPLSDHLGGYGDGPGGYGTIFIHPATQEVEVAHESRTEAEFDDMLDEMEEQQDEDVDEEEDN